VIIGYGLAFYFMTLVLKTMPVGITYAIKTVIVRSIGAVLLFFKHMDNHHACNNQRHPYDRRSTGNFLISDCTDA
jgi:hypothetical protein